MTLQTPVPLDLVLDRIPFDEWRFCLSAASSDIRDLPTVRVFSSDRLEEVCNHAF